MGTADERNPAHSRGNSPDGDDLPLNNNSGGKKEPGSGELSGFSMQKNKSGGDKGMDGADGQTGFFMKKKMLPDETYEQMSLFSDMGEPVWNPATDRNGMEYVPPAAFPFPDDQTDAVLRSGGGRNGSRKRIYAGYQQGKTPEEMAAFLKEEYGTTGKGFIFDGQKVSVWFDADGMRIARGSSAKTSSAVFFTWEETEQRIRRMVESGTYMAADEVSLVDASERQRIAGHLLYFFRDGIQEMPDEIRMERAGHPEYIERLSGLLAEKEGIRTLSAHIEKAREQLATGAVSLRWNYVMKPEMLIRELDGLLAEKRKFPEASVVKVLQEDFITQDEMDAVFRRGSGTQNGRFRMYEQFMGDHTAKENVDFLKKEYGTGGSSHALPGSDTGNEEHGHRGIRLRKGGYLEPYLDVLLKWGEVEKRIRGLVRSGSYLGPDGMKAFAQYKKEQAAGVEESSLDAGVEESSLDAGVGESSLDAGVEKTVWMQMWEKIVWTQIVQV